MNDESDNKIKILTVCIGLLLICVVWYYRSNKVSSTSHNVEDEEAMRRLRLRRFERRKRSDGSEKTHQDVVDTKKEDVSTSSSKENNTATSSTATSSTTTTTTNQKVAVMSTSTTATNTEKTSKDYSTKEEKKTRKRVSTSSSSSSFPLSCFNLSTGRADIDTKNDDDNDDGTKWVELDRRTDILFNKRFERKIFQMSSTKTNMKKFREYRLRILSTRKADCDMCQMSRFEIFLNNGSIDEIIANDENAPTETTEKLLDSDTTTKWLCRKRVSRVTREQDEELYWISCLVSGEVKGEGAIITRYALTSANDCPERDPTSWILEARVCPSSIFSQKRAERLIPVSRPIGSIKKLMSWSVKDVSRSEIGAVPLAKRVVCVFLSV